MRETEQNETELNLLKNIDVQESLFNQGDLTKNFQTAKVTASNPLMMDIKKRALSGTPSGSSSYYDQESDSNDSSILKKEIVFENVESQKLSD